MKLARREKIFISALTGVIGIIIILQLIVFPFFDEKKRLVKGAVELENLINEMAALNAGGPDIGGISGSLERVLSRRKESLFAFVSREAESVGLTQQNIGGIDPSEGKTQGDYQEDRVEVDLKAITLPQLRKFLARIENPEMFIFVIRSNISKNKKEEGYLDATIRVMSYKKVNQ